MMQIHNVRLGFATNSSSTHSIMPEWISVHEDPMLSIIEKARARLNRPKLELIQGGLRDDA